MSTYKIRDGFTVRLDDRTVLGSGDVIDLDDETAALHAHKLEPAETDAPKKPKAAAKADAPEKADAVTDELPKTAAE